MTSKKGSDPTWSDVKAKLMDFDRAGMLRLVQDLYAASRDNQNSLHACFGLGPDVASKKSADLTWSDVRVTLVYFDRTGLLRLLQDLYTVSKDNRNFLHARFGLGSDVLEPYKAIIRRWLWPDIDRDQDYSTVKAKKPIADYKKAAGLPQGIAELSVFYCEQAIGFSSEVGLDDRSYYDAVWRMFKQALSTVMVLPETDRPPFLDRLNGVRLSARGLGWGLENELNVLWGWAGLELSDE